MDMTPAQLATKRAIDALGGPVKAARLLNVKDHRYQTVQSWVTNRVPAEHCPIIERETRAAGQPVTCEELRPDIPWGVLREQAAPLSEPEAGEHAAASELHTQWEADRATCGPARHPNAPRGDHSMPRRASDKPNASGAGER